MFIVVFTAGAATYAQTCKRERFLQLSAASNSENMATKALTLYFILSCAALFASAQSDGTNECEAAKAAYHTATGILDLEGEAIYSRLQSGECCE